MRVASPVGALIAGVLVTGTLLSACSSGSEGSASPSASPSDPATTPAPASPSASPAAPTTASPSSASASAQPVDPRAGLTVAGTVARGLDAPWGLAFLPDGSALVSQRDEATIVRIAGGRVSRVGEVAGVEPAGEGGLLGIAVAEDFAQQPWLYVYFTGSTDNRVVRMQYRSGRLEAPEVLVRGIPKAGRHNGGRLTFGPDGDLYIGTGDAGNTPNAQNRNSLGGKILRIKPDGSIPADNPFSGSPVWSYGHRNVQGLTFDTSGRLWASEFGQDTWDELNLITKGGDYGWPIAEGRSDDDRFINPVAQWRTDDASPSGVAYYRGAVYMAALRGERLWQVPVSGEDRDPRAFFTGRYGRIRTVAVAPDGSLWVITSNTDGRGDPQSGDDKILRVRLS